MRRFHRPRTAIITITLLAALGFAVRADAGAVTIDTCQTLSIPNTVYKLTADLTSTGDCLIVAADKITIDLQGHTIAGAGQIPSSAHHRRGQPAQ